MNRAILGSVIAGIAIMMTVSVIGPAYAASPWLPLYTCPPTGGTNQNTELYWDNQGCTTELVIVECPHQSGQPGQLHVRDSDGDNISDSAEAKRCVKG